MQNPIFSKKSLTGKKEITLNTADNSEITIDHYGSSQRKNVLVICPSLNNDKNTGLYQKIAIDFFSFIDVIILSYRGHNKDSNSFTFTTKEEEDLKTAINYAKARYSNIFILGFSFGAAIALTYTSKYKNSKNIKGVIPISASYGLSSLKENLYRFERDIPSYRKIEVSKKHYHKSENILMEKVVSIYVKSDTTPVSALFINNDNNPAICSWYIEELSNIDGSYEIIGQFGNDFLAENTYIKFPDKFIKICQDWLNKVLAESKFTEELKQQIPILKKRPKCSKKKIDKICEDKSKISVNMQFQDDSLLEIIYQ